MPPKFPCDRVHFKERKEKNQSGGVFHFALRAQIVYRVELNRTGRGDGVCPGAKWRELADVRGCKTVMGCFLTQVLPLWAQMLLPLWRDWPCNNFHLPNSSLSAPMQCRACSLRAGGRTAAEAQGWLKLSIMGCFSRLMFINFAGLADYYFFFFCQVLFPVVFLRKDLLP